MGDTDLPGDRSSRRGQRRVLAEVISHQTHRAGPDLRINLLSHVLIPRTQKDAASNLGRFTTSAIVLWGPSWKIVVRKHSVLFTPLIDSMRAL